MEQAHAILTTMTRPAHNSSWETSPLFPYWGVTIAVIGSFGCGIEAEKLARILHAGKPALANQYWVTSFTAVMFGILATCGIIAIRRAVRGIRSDL